MTAGVYRITNLKSGKAYIGSSINLRGRKREHFADLRAGRHHNAPLQRAFLKVSEKRIAFEVLLLCRPEDAVWYEQRAIDRLRPEYNICRIAGSALGRKHSDATKAKISAVTKGRRPTEETKQKIRESKLRENLSAEVRANMSAGQMGKIHSAEARAKISAAAKARTGWTHSPETKAKMSVAAKGRRKSDTHVAAIREANQGKCKLSVEQVRHARRLHAKGVTQKGIAGMLGVTQGTISALLRGKTYQSIL